MQIVVGYLGQMLDLKGGTMEEAACTSMRNQYHAESLFLWIKSLLTW